MTCCVIAAKAGATQHALKARCPKPLKRSKAGLGNMHCGPRRPQACPNPQKNVTIPIRRKMQLQAQPHVHGRANSRFVPIPGRDWLVICLRG